MDWLATNEPEPPTPPLPGIVPQQPQRGDNVRLGLVAEDAGFCTVESFPPAVDTRVQIPAFPLPEQHGPVVLAADLYQLPEGIKPSDLRGKRWETVERTLSQLGAVSLPPWPTYPNDKKYRWSDSRTRAIWEVRYHTERNTQYPDGPSGAGKYSIKFGRLVAAQEGYDGDTRLPDDVFARLNAKIGVQLGDTTTQWIDRTGWLYYRYDDVPGGFFSDETHTGMDQYDTGRIIWQPSGLSTRETRTHGWRAQVEELGKRQWQATITRLADGSSIVAPTFFPNVDVAQRWCLEQLGQEYPLILFAHGLDQPTPSSAVRQRVLAHVRSYDTVAAHRVVPWALDHWGERRARVLRTNDDYRTWPWLGREPTDFFWYMITNLDLKAREPVVPPGPIRLEREREIEREGQEWGEELVQVPMDFYTVIYSFTLAIGDWLQTCDMTVLIKDEQSKQARRKAMKTLLREWQIAFSLE